MLLFSLNRAALTATSETVEHTKSVLTSVRTSKNWRLFQVLFDVGESTIALFFPSGPVGFLEGGKKVLRRFVGPGNKPPQGSQLVDQLLYPLSGARS